MNPGVGGSNPLVDTNSPRAAASVQYAALLQACPWLDGKEPSAAYHTGLFLNTRSGARWRRAGPSVFTSLGRKADGFGPPMRAAGPDKLVRLSAQPQEKQKSGPLARLFDIVRRREVEGLAAA